MLVVRKGVYIYSDQFCPKVVWGSNKAELVQKAACWRTGVLEPYVLKPMQENIPYDWWLECCMADCPPNWSHWSEIEVGAQRAVCASI